MFENGIKGYTLGYLHHTVIPPWIYRIPSELRSQAGLGLPSTVVGDHTGIVSAVCFFFLALSKSNNDHSIVKLRGKKTPSVGIEPTTIGLKGQRSTI